MKDMKYYEVYVNIDWAIDQDEVKTNANLKAMCNTDRLKNENKIELRDAEWYEDEAKEDLLNDLKKLQLSPQKEVGYTKFNIYNPLNEGTSQGLQRVVLAYDAENKTLQYKAPFLEGTANAITLHVQDLPNESHTTASRQHQVRATAWAKDVPKQCAFKSPEKRVNGLFSSLFYVNTNFRSDNKLELNRNGGQTNNDHSDPRQIYSL